MLRPDENRYASAVREAVSRHLLGCWPSRGCRACTGRPRGSAITLTRRPHFQWPRHWCNDTNGSQISGGGREVSMAAKREAFVRTLRAQWLGQQMRELREQRGLTLKYVGWSFWSAIFHRWLGDERAEWPFRRDVVVDRCSTSTVSYDEREREPPHPACTRMPGGLTAGTTSSTRLIYDTSFIDFPWLESRGPNRSAPYASPADAGASSRRRDYAEAVIRNAEAQLDQRGADPQVGPTPDGPAAAA